MKTEVETRVPKDIRSYKTKIIGSLTLRQLICVGIAVFLDLILYTMVFSHMDIDKEVMMYILIFLDLPILIFITEPNGMKFEVYLKDVIVPIFLWPRYRRSVKVINSQKPVEIGERTKKEKKQLQEQHPELKAYK